jgi:ribonuclease P protein component
MHGRRMVLFVAPGTGDAAFVAGRRVGGAVDRNRARRILRAAFRQVASEGVVNRDVVLVAREDIRGARSSDLVEEMGELLEQAGARA